MNFNCPDHDHIHWHPRQRRIHACHTFSKVSALVYVLCKVKRVLKCVCVYVCVCRQEFSNVSALAHFLCKVTKESTFHKFLQL